LKTTSVPISVEVVAVAPGVVELSFEAQDAVPGFLFYVVGRGTSLKQVTPAKGATKITEGTLDPETQICWRLAAVFSTSGPVPTPAKPATQVCLKARP